MKIRELLGELKEKEAYKEFIAENLDAFFCSAMVVLGEGDKIDLNFFIPSKKRISSFAMPFGSVTDHVEEIVEQEEISDLGFKVDVCDLGEVTGNKFKKIIGVLHGGVWNLTLLNGLDMCRMNVDAYTGEVEEKEKGNLMDMVRFRSTKSS